ncbi:hypothetical protein UCRPC4_g06680 [Phaeomoniella chlamydospora]|uniref:Uncharacterized protein n=1 Tax=Phaeomoniella chlamydospora TaxID=158046 RepID=A0A0G2DWS7_PHACM|nr:hypothetical protein UCRPC4_g06680 [Phaeomoniella chlamydospora]
MVRAFSERTNDKADTCAKTSAGISSGTVASRVRGFQDAPEQEKNAQQFPKPRHVMTRLSDIAEHGTRVGHGRRLESRFAAPAGRASRTGNEGTGLDNLPPIGHWGHGPCMLEGAWAEGEGALATPYRPSTNLNSREPPSDIRNVSLRQKTPRRYRSMEVMASRNERNEAQEISYRLKSLRENCIQRLDHQASKKGHDSTMLDELESMIDNALEQQKSVKDHGASDSTAIDSNAESNLSSNKGKDRKVRSASISTSEHPDSRRHSFLEYHDSWRPHDSYKSPSRTMPERRQSQPTEIVRPRAGSETLISENGHDRSVLLLPKDQVLGEVKQATSPTRRSLTGVRARAAIFENANYEDSILGDRGQRNVHSVHYHGRGNHNETESSLTRGQTHSIILPNGRAHDPYHRQAHNQHYQTGKSGLDQGHIHQDVPHGGHEETSHSSEKHGERAQSRDIHPEQSVGLKAHEPDQIEHRLQDKDRKQSSASFDQTLKNQRALEAIERPAGSGTDGDQDHTVRDYSQGEKAAGSPKPIENKIGSDGSERKYVEATDAGATDRDRVFKGHSMGGTISERIRRFERRAMDTQAPHESSYHHKQRLQDAVGRLQQDINGGRRIDQQNDHAGAKAIDSRSASVNIESSRPSSQSSGEEARERHAAARDQQASREQNIIREREDTGVMEAESEHEQIKTGNERARDFSIETDDVDPTKKSQIRQPGSLQETGETISSSLLRGRQMERDWERNEEFSMSHGGVSVKVRISISRSPSRSAMREEQRMTTDSQVESADEQTIYIKADIVPNKLDEMSEEE